MHTYRVLIVDDQFEVRRLLRAGVETLDRDIQVVDVPSGEEAILVIAQEPVDLLITDIRLAGISGLELIERAKNRNPNLKLILITGLADALIRQQVANAGAEAFFYKPIGMADFLGAVQRCLDDVQTTVLKSDISEEVGAPVPDLSMYISDLHKETQAAYVALIDGSGRVLAHAGELPGIADSPTWNSVWITILNAAKNAADFLGKSPPADLLYISGKEFDLLISHVGVSTALMAWVDSTARGDEQFWNSLHFVRQTAKDLASALANVQAGGESLEEPSAALAPDESGAEADDAGAIGDLDAILSQAEKGSLKPEEVDAFWETLAANQGSEEVKRKDALSYEEARRLGLAPQE